MATTMSQSTRDEYLEEMRDRYRRYGGKLAKTDASGSEVPAQVKSPLVENVLDMAAFDGSLSSCVLDSLRRGRTRRRGP
jgi:hypothetical protein